MAYLQKAPFSGSIAPDPLVERIRLSLGEQPLTQVESSFSKYTNYVRRVIERSLVLSIKNMKNSLVGNIFVFQPPVVDKAQQWFSITTHGELNRTNTKGLAIVHRKERVALAIISRLVNNCNLE